MYLLGIDLGSSSVKVALVDSMSGRCVAQDYYPKIEAPIKALQAGWAEQSPADWVGYFKLALGSVLESSRINAADIAAIGISYQMHSLVAVDRAGRLLRDAIIWCDSRGVPYGEKAFADLGADTCLGHLLNSPGNFTAAKLKWVKENEPQVFDSIYKVMLPGDYLAYCLTGEMCTTAEGLSEMMLWDFSTDSPATFLMEYMASTHRSSPVLCLHLATKALSRLPQPQSLASPRVLLSLTAPVTSPTTHSASMCSNPARWRRQPARAELYMVSTAQWTMTLAAASIILPTSITARGALA